MLTSYLSNLIIKGGVAPVFDTPADFGLEPEDVSFPSTDGVTLRGWLFRGNGQGIIVQSHYVNYTENATDIYGVTHLVMPADIHLHLGIRFTT